MASDKTANSSDMTLEKTRFNFMGSDRTGELTVPARIYARSKYLVFIIGLIALLS